MELEIKDDRAEVLENVLLFETGVGRVFSGILNQYVRFVIPSSGKNKSRREIAKWWTDLVDSVDRVKLTRKPKEKTIEEVREWVKKQIGPTLAMLMIHDEGDMSELLKIIHSGKHRLKQQHLQILSNARNIEKTSEKTKGS